VHSRGGAIDLALEGKAPEPTFDDKSEALLQSLATNKLGLVMLSLDIVGLHEAVAGSCRCSLRTDHRLRGVRT
jgi:hypothetical protein